jgi:membrane fusion protein, heavy metal efflux system
VQPTTAGRIEAGPKGLPALGQRVARGEVLAWVRATESATPELTVNLELARRKLARLEQLEGAVPQRDIESARIEVQSLTQRLSPGAGSFVAREALLAPVSGVIAAAQVVAGQVVEPREILFEVLDPARLHIEALAFDAHLAADIAAASVATGNGAGAELVFLGGGAQLRDGALPLQFRIRANGKPLGLAVGQAVKVIVRTKTTSKGHAVPAAAIVKGPGNQDIVWTHAGAEHFLPRPVRWAALDGAQVAVLAGLKDGERVVTSGAALVNQVR